jgi:hypothetical protein
VRARCRSSRSYRIVAAHFEDTMTFFPMLGEYEIWQLINLTGGTHPIHLHLDPFQILARRPIRYQIPEGGIGERDLAATVTLERDRSLPALRELGSSDDCAQGRQQVAIEPPFPDVLGGAGLGSLERAFFVVVAADQHNPRPWADSANLPRCCEAVHLRHANVDHSRVWPQPLGELDCLAAVTSSRDDEELAVFFNKLS